jgi:hypothetical protein
LKKVREFPERGEGVLLKIRSVYIHPLDLGDLGSQKAFGKLWKTLAKVN